MLKLPLGLNKILWINCISQVESDSVLKRSDNLVFQQFSRFSLRVEETQNNPSPAASDVVSVFLTVVSLLSEPLVSAEEVGRFLPFAFMIF